MSTPQDPSPSIKALRCGQCQEPATWEVLGLPETLWACNQHLYLAALAVGGYAVVEIIPTSTLLPRPKDPDQP